MVDIGREYSTRHEADEGGTVEDARKADESRPRAAVRTMAAVAVVVAGSVAAVALVAQTEFPPGVRLLALGVACAFLIVAGRRRARPWTVVPDLLLVLWGVWLLPSVRVEWAIVATGAALGAAVGAAWSAAMHGIVVRTSAPRRPRQRQQWGGTGRGVVGAAVLLLAVATFWTGATSPTVTWFGGLVSHGPRTSNRIALTFDDGPNGRFTLETAALLDRYGVRGTFFLVGKAVAREPDVVRELVADGHLVGSHSYQHDAWRWLDPRYPELARADDVIREVAGVCPAFFRPPHGEHTPFMAHAVESQHLTMVTWDVSAADWATTNAAMVARRVLRHVRPGSIVLLHDGLDGNADQNRAVVLRALPRILDGLRRRGLHPVTLDRLLRRPAYQPTCGLTRREARRESPAA